MISVLPPKILEAGDRTPKEQGDWGVPKASDTQRCKAPAGSVKTFGAEKLATAQEEWEEWYGCQR